jgi:uncharacterized protein (DUF924 family)
VSSEDERLNAAEILAFWFSDRVKPKWFEPDAAFDAELNERFRPAHERARAGDLGSWAGTPEGALALVILLDQIPRNIERGRPAAFATDEQALAIAKQAVGRGFDAGLDPEKRQFLYLPFMHSERLEDQERGLELYTALGLTGPLDFMRQHRDVIARFGRFPHRNEMLARQSTEEEIAFLKQPGSRF